MMTEILEQPKLALDVPPPPGQAWREHTAERWARDGAESYAECVELIRSGVTNQSELARLFGKDRKMIRALMLREFHEEELGEISRKCAIIARAQGIDKTAELIDQAHSSKDVGGVAMATQIMHTIAQVMSDKPTSIHEERVVISVEDYMRQLEEPPVVVEVEGEFTMMEEPAT